MSKDFIYVLVLTFFQNASFTLVSRARNSSSIKYHLGASILSNGIYLLVFRKLSMNLTDEWVLVAYLIGSVLGSVAMHAIAMRHLE